MVCVLVCLNVKHVVDCNSRRLKSIQRRERGSVSHSQPLASASASIVSFIPVTSQVPSSARGDKLQWQ